MRILGYKIESRVGEPVLDEPDSSRISSRTTLAYRMKPPRSLRRELLTTVDSVTSILRATIVVILHTCFAAVIVTVIHCFEVFIRYLNNGEDPLVFDKLPLRYIFQLIDLGVIAAFGWHAIRDVFSAFDEDAIGDDE
jgi:hypothetical protein